jgi:hypothetical protein
MKVSRLASSAVVFFASIVGAPQSHAEQAAACTHPALARGEACTAQAGIDANTFIVLPPASTRWVVRGGRANADHPAVAVARMQKMVSVDANTFIVQPPVAVTWTVAEPVTLLAVVPTTRPAANAN